MEYITRSTPNSSIGALSRLVSGRASFRDSAGSVGIVPKESDTSEATPEVEDETPEPTLDRLEDLTRRLLQVTKDEVHKVENANGHGRQV